MPSVAHVVADLGVESRPGDRIATPTPTTDRVLEVWLCLPGGGSRIKQLPPETVHNVTWTDTRGAAASASFDLDLFAADGDGWLVDQVRFDPAWGVSEIQVVWEGVVVHWGPVTGKAYDTSNPRAKITVADPSWYFGRRLAGTSSDPWTIDRITNPGFAEGMSRWSWDGLGDTPTISTTIVETGTKSLFVGDAAKVSQQIMLPFPGTYRLRVRMRVRLSHDAQGGGLTASRNELEQDLTWHADISDAMPRQQWIWITAEQRIVHEMATLPAVDTVTIRAPDIGDMHVDRVNALIQPADLGVEQEQSDPWDTMSNAVAGLIRRGGDGVNVAAVVSGVPSTPMQPAWLARGDMFVSEGLRAAAEAPTPVETRWLYSPTVRACEARPLVGVDHDPAALTLRAQGGAGAPVYGNTASIGVDAGVESPTNRVVARAEDGWTDSAEDLSKWGGVVLEDQVQARIGAVDLASTANARLAISDGQTRSLTLALTDQSLISLLRRGDRAKVVVDVGPIQIDQAHRIESITYRPGADVPVSVSVVPWAGVRPGLPATPVRSASVEGQLVQVERRTYDVERRLNGVGGGVQNFVDLDDAAARITEHGPVLTEGDVWGINNDGKWDIITPGGGGGGAFSTMRISGEFDPITGATSVVDWSEASAPPMEMSKHDEQTIMILEPGIYQITGSAHSQDFMAPVEVAVWCLDTNYDLGDGLGCRGQGQSIDVGGWAAATSMDVAVKAGGHVTISVTCSGVASFLFAVHLVAQVPVWNCGEVPGG